jgi:outer membrane protein assembly factor BamB
MRLSPLGRCAETRTAISAIALTILSASIAFGGDWPEWGGHDDRNLVAGEKGLPDDFVPGEKKPDGSGIDMATTRNVKWVARLGSQTYGNPTISAGRVFVGTNDFAIGDPKYRSTRGGLVECLDAATGKLLWKLVIPRLETNDPNFNFDNLDLGVCSSPTVDGDRIYLVTNRCEVVCLDVNGMANGNDGPVKDEGQYSVGPGKPPVRPGRDDADVIWRYNMIADLPVWPQDAANCSILVHGDFLYVCTSNGVDRSHDRLPYPLAPSLIVLDKHTGRLVAKDDEKIGTRTFHGNWSNPSLGFVHGRPLVFFGGGDGICYAFEALAEMPDRIVPLKKAWSFDCNPPSYHFKDGKPIPYRSGDVRLHRGNNNDGKFVGPSEIIATPVFFKNRVYVATGQDPSHGRGRGILCCIDATQAGDVTQTGKIWTYDKIGRSLSTVSIADGLLYIAETFGPLHCLDADTGKCYWTHDTKAEIWGSTLVDDGKVYLGTQKGLFVFAAGKQKRLLHEIRLGAPVYSTPVAANGVLYVASQRYLWAVKAKP